MDRRVFMNAVVITVGAVAFARPVWAQRVARTFRLGYLAERSGVTEFEEALVQGLRELGYVEGRNLVIEYRWAAGKADQIPAMAADLVALNVDVIVTSGFPAAKAAKAATATIPIVMATSGDAVSDGLVASFGRPGGKSPGCRCTRAS